MYHEITGNYMSRNSEGKLHSYNDLPSYVYNYDKGHFIWYEDNVGFLMHKGTKMWHKNGRVHRDNNLPAVINGHRVYWFTNGFHIKDISIFEYNKKLYPAIQLYRVKSAKEDSSFYLKWNKSKILEPKLTKLIIEYI